MASTYYLWGNVKIAEKDQQSKSVKHKTLTAGTPVSESDFNEEDWANFTKLGLIRKAKYPKVRAGESVRSALLRKAKADFEAATAVGTPETRVEQQISDSEVDEDEDNENEEEEEDNAGQSQPNAKQKKPWE